MVTGLDAFFVRSDLLRDRRLAVAPLTALPAERLLDWVDHYCDSKRQRRRCTLGGLADPIAIGGLGFKCKWAPHAWWSLVLLEDYAVYERTGDHCAARAAALQSSYARELIRSGYQFYRGNLTNAALLGTSVAAIEHGFGIPARVARRLKVGLSPSELDEVVQRALAVLPHLDMEPQYPRCTKL